jgi:DNA-binding transcriptional MerR regulator
VEKAPDAFRTISEVADELDVPQHVLRFWESRFREIKPMKRGGGRRYYRPEDVELLRGIRHLLYGEGYTIRGVQRILKDQGIKFVQSVWQPGAPQVVQRAADEETAEEESEAPAVVHGSARTQVQPPLRQHHVSPAASERREPSPPRQALPTEAVRRGMAPAELAKLKDALRELTECRVQLDAAIREAALGDATWGESAGGDAQRGEAGTP